MNKKKGGRNADSLHTATSVSARGYVGTEPCEQNTSVQCGTGRGRQLQWWVKMEEVLPDKGC